MLIYPHLESRRIKLVPGSISRESYEIFLQSGIESLPTLDRYLEEFRPDEVSAYFYVDLQATGERVGVTTLHAMNPNAGHIEAGLYIGDKGKGAPGVGHEAGLLTINYAFAMWNVRKVYIKTTEASIPSLGSKLGNLKREAILPDHFFFCGRLWDVHIYAVYRVDWEAGIGEYLRDRIVADAESDQSAKLAQQA
ncbi:GNAT family protein [Nocardiopsis dassonvillei]|uniref:GNAT family N-acetyltransferase n=1 Tax=Nocardiopsis dassonvillei TaxID=2014 RepID=UPI00200FE138|nr:GNAT family protein [Nocardiopsis dassonvillei]MCK9874149.1 GNAT family N-acetyltransferase [Nocardiopsis dassonvillei]